MRWPPPARPGHEISPSGPNISACGGPQIGESLKICYTKVYVFVFVFVCVCVCVWYENEWNTKPQPSAEVEVTKTESYLFETFNKLCVVVVFVPPSFNNRL